MLVTGKQTNRQTNSRYWKHINTQSADLHQGSVLIALTSYLESHGDPYHPKKSSIVPYISLQSYPENFITICPYLLKTDMISN